MEPEVTAAFQCTTGASAGEPHDWDYRRRATGNSYRCKKCLVIISKARLKELTDNA